MAANVVPADAASGGHPGRPVVRNSSERSENPDGIRMRTDRKIQNQRERRVSGRAVLSGPVALSSFRFVTALAVASGSVGVLSAGAAAADPVSLTLRYTCSTPLIDDLPVTVRIDADIPESAAVGQPTPEFAVNAAVPVDVGATKMLGKIGVKAIEGTVDAKARVAAPEGDTYVTLPFGVKADIPVSGSFQIKATGSAPALTFTQPGSAKVTVGDLVAHLSPQDASGDVTFPGKIDARCTMDAGQKNVLASFQITGVGTATGRSASGTMGTTDGAASGTSETDGTASGTTAAKPNGVLPRTGAGATPWLLGGAGLLFAVGAGTIFAVRRTRTDDGAGT
ncbi:DUF6801 domain-containing protein [Streptomyces hyaluromycini]|uniref:DUF6801 domain-containing protein n=1 Tax=Streptomyces hyaluromycini TaxID=1377993 RepID=A0ABV1WM24_9ACTN